MLQLQGDELNGNGRLFYQNNPKRKVKIVNGTGLAIATILNSLPQGTKNVQLTGKLSKMACVLALTLCQKGIKVYIYQSIKYLHLKMKFDSNTQILISDR